MYLPTAGLEPATIGYRPNTLSIDKRPMLYQAELRR